MNEGLGWTFWISLGSFVIGIIGITAALAFGIPSYNRYQARQNANNEVSVNEITIRQQEQLIKVEQQKALGY